MFIMLVHTFHMEVAMSKCFLSFSIEQLIRTSFSWLYELWRKYPLDHLLLMIFWACHFSIFLESGQFCHYHLQARALFTSLILAQRMVLLIQSHHTLFHARGVLIMYDILYALIIQIVE